MRSRFINMWNKFRDLLFNKKNIWLLFVLLIAQLLYLGLSHLRYRIGFPLDDAWIHQTYARNFAQTGVWAFNPNVASGGSTAPLWSLMLVPGHWFTGEIFKIHTFVISWVLLFAASVIFENLLTRITKTNWAFPVFGSIFLLEWHFIWAANSGMETILFVFLIVLFFYLLEKKKLELPIFIVLSLVFWVRPDGITLIGPLLFVAFFNWRGINKRKVLLGSAIFAMSIIGYLLLNLRISGTVFPNTFYAKQTEYAALYEVSIFKRYWNMLFTQFVGIGILLIPGLIYQAISKFLKRYWEWYAGLLWWLGYLLIYALRLPVTYQHGRYQIPAISVYLLLAVPGCIALLNTVFFGRYKLLGKAWITTSLIILLIFAFLGANAYATDVAIIESEMVDTVLWINAHVEEDAVIAAHDIGALGFYGNREVVDLAGLISADVIPYMVNEDKLIEYLGIVKPDYLMTFENWYAVLPKYGQIIYNSNAEFSVNAGGDLMQVYIWER